MEELFNTQLPDGERPDIYLCIFPHLREFLAVDLREDSAGISLLNANEVFTGEFFLAVEEEFSEAIRAKAEFPFAHLISMPLRVEESIRETAMSFIMDRLGPGPDPEYLPTVVVFMVSGGALAAQPGKVLNGLKELLRSHRGETASASWDDVLSRLVKEEDAALKSLNRNELSDALRGDSPDYFTLWENRN